MPEPNKDKIITVLSHQRFDEKMEEMGVNDSNVETFEDYAFISIIGTDECLKWYLHEEGTKHWFKEEHDNVLNLEFDDLENDIEYFGHTFKAMSEEQAEKTFHFIERNLGRNFIIHCRAGMSRSQGVAFFIKDTYNDWFKEEQPSMNRDFANKGVIRKLNKLIWNISFNQDEYNKIVEESNKRAIDKLVQENIA